MRLKSWVWPLIVVFSAVGAASAEVVQISAVDMVVSGDSTNRQKQVMIRANTSATNGANSACNWGQYSLFYVPDNWTIPTDFALSMGMTAKVSGRSLMIDYMVVADPVEFWSYGVTRCRIHRIGLY